MVDNIQAIILAGGKSRRFATGRTKLIEKICGLEMILYSTTTFKTLGIPTTLLVGYQKEMLLDVIKKHHGYALNFFVQPEQKGTGHALLCTKPAWDKDHIIVVNGDNPLIKQETFEKLIATHLDTKAAITFLCAHNADPSLAGYGRVIKEQSSIKIIESKDFKGDPSQYCCVNAGIYIFSRKFLENNIEKLDPNNSAQEFYITDLIAIASAQNLTVETVNAPFDEIRGINTNQELWTAEQIKRAEIISFWMERGVRFHGAQTTHLDYNISIEIGTQIGAGAQITEGTTIGKNCIIECFSVINNSKIRDNVTIYSHSVISNSNIESFCKIGPFAHIEAESSIDEHSVIGNFMQVKRSSVGKNTKAKHLSFLGDAIVGSNSNIGAGTITCNYDGFHKNPTIIQDHCFIGSNNTLIAPLVVGSHSFTAAGSVITKDIPEQGFAIARTPQVIKENYAPKLRKKKSESEPKETPLHPTPAKTSTYVSNI